MMDIENIRKDFPMVDELIYFDNACISLKPRQVIERVDEYYNEYPVCGGGRSSHSLSTGLARRIQKGRKALADLLNADKKEEIVFTKNTTEAINLVARGLGLEKDDVVMTTDKEHNSNHVPWIKLRENEGVGFERVPSTEEGRFDIERFKDMMNDDVELVSMYHTSNLDGTSIPAKVVAQVAHDHDALFLLDGAQSVPHREVDVKKIGADLLTFSVHKMVGPTGVGVLYGRQELLEELEPLIYGGGGVRDSNYEGVTLQSSPAKFESGLQNYSSLCAVEESVRYLQDIGLDEIEKHEIRLNEIVTERLKDKVNLLGPEEPEERSGIFNFWIEKLGSHEISLMLEEKNILTRSGTQCVHPWYNAQGIEGGLRASFYLYNTEEEVEEFVETLEKLLF